MAERPASIEPWIWAKMSKPSQNAAAASAGLAAGQRSDLQKAVWERVRGFRAAGPGGAPAAPGGGGGAPGGGGGTGGAPRPSGGGVDLKGLLGTTSATAVGQSRDLMEKLFHAAGFSGDLDSILKGLDLGYTFTGAEQFRRNQGGEWGFAENDPVFQNVAMTSLLSDPQSLQRVIGETMGMLERGQDVQALWQARGAQVPDWAPAVYDQLTSSGTPWSTELFGSPSIQYRDASKPLFEAGAHPASLWQLTGGQAGEEGYYAGLSAAELMSQVYPAYAAYYHRGAGEPVPAGMEAGMMFGSPVYSEGREMGDGGAGDPFTRTPVQSTPSYKRYTTLGLGQGGVLGTEGGGSFNPLTGAGQVGQYDPMSLGGQITSGRLLPEHLFPFVPDWRANMDLLRDSLGVMGTAAYGYPDQYFEGDRAPFAPWMLDPQTLERLMAYLQQQQGLTPAAAAEEE